MKTNLIAQSAAIADAIHFAFRGSSACHCHGDGKLSETELLDALCRRGHVHYADTGKQALDILRLLHFGGGNPSYSLRQRGVNYLPQLQEWTFADLIALRGVGVTFATQIEFTMSRYGLALKDGPGDRERHNPAKRLDFAVGAAGPDSAPFSVRGAPRPIMAGSPPNAIALRGK